MEGGGHQEGKSPKPVKTALSGNNKLAPLSLPP